MPLAPRDDYYVMMWDFLDPIFSSGPEKARLALQRFREAGCNGAACHACFIDPPSFLQYIKRVGLEDQFPFKTPPMGTSPFLENDFPIWIENICRALTWKWDKAKPELRKQYEAFARQRDRRVFIRRPCVNDPEVAAATGEHIATMMKTLAPARHLTMLYDVRDEPSVCSFMLANDTCFCEHCLGRMRQWLQGRYGDLSALNAEWGTDFGSWGQVEPITTQEVIERRVAGNWNFSPWADHREFMDDSFARAVAEYAGHIKRHDPDALCGLEGTQCPWVFGGWDFARLTPVLEWAEPYAYACAIDCFRSFKRSRDFRLIKASGLGSDPVVRQLLLWHYLFQAGGYSGSLVWASNTVLQCDKETWPLADAAKAFAPVYRELRSGIPRLLQLTEEISSPVAVHYSQASIRADFINSSPERWASVAAAEPERFAAFRCREAWWRLLEDRGLRPVFMASGQIEAGELLSRGIKVLVLSRSIALSDAEAAAIRSFVETGGTLLADSFVGRMDEHCRERIVGVLDDLFGIRRTETDGYHSSTQRASLDYAAPADERPAWGAGPLRAEAGLIEEGIEPLPGTRVLGCTEYSDTPIGLLTEHGKGRAVLLNCAPLDYLRVRRAAGGAQTGKFFGGALDLAGVRPELEISNASGDRPVTGWQVFPFRHGRARYFGVTPDPGITQDTLGAIGSADAGEAARRRKIRFPLAGHVYESRSGAYFGQADSIIDQLRPDTAKLYVVMPYRVEGLELSAAEGVASVRLKASADIGQHVFRFDLLDSEGNRLPDQGANVVSDGGLARWSLPVPLPTCAKLTCRDVATGVSADAPLVGPGRGSH